MEILSHKVMTLHNRLLETGNKDRSRWSSIIYAFQVKYKVFGGLDWRDDNFDFRT